MGEDLFPSRKVLSLSWKEAVAEKLKAAISRKDVAIRDYYDLWYIAEFGFDFYDKNFSKFLSEKCSMKDMSEIIRKISGSVMTISLFCANK